MSVPPSGNSPAPSSTAPTTIIGRRSVATGLAWSLPVLTVAAGAPASAASPVAPVYPTDKSAACKITAGQKIYEFTLVFENLMPLSTTLCLISGKMFANGCDADFDITTATPSQCVSVAAGKTATIVVDSVAASCLANGYATLTYSYVDVNGKTQNVTTQTVFNSVKPC